MPAWVAAIDLDDGLFAAGQQRLHVALEQRRERLLVLPLGMLRRQRLHAVEREERAGSTSAARPRACRRCRRWRCARPAGTKSGAAFLRDLRDEVDDGLLRRAVVPRGQRVGCARATGANAPASASSASHGEQVLRMVMADRRRKLATRLQGSAVTRRCRWPQPRRDGRSRLMQRSPWLLSAGAASCSFASTWSSEKLPGFCRGGNST